MSVLEAYRVEWPAHSMNEQRVYKFPNGYGASVVRGPYTYGGPTLWELAVIEWTGDEWSIVYGTPITSDVLGYLTDDAVTETLTRIEALRSSRERPVAASGISQFDREHIADILAGAGSWFTADLLRLCAHADEGNLNRIRQGFPDVVETYLAWREGDNE